jgi:hypothetical protein
VGIVEAKDAGACRIMQGERVTQPVRSLGGWVRPLDFEFQPIALFEVVDSSVERQQEGKGVFVGNGRVGLVLYGVMIP